MMRFLLVVLVLFQSAWADGKTTRAVAKSYEKTQTVTYVPIMVGDITIMIPTGSGMPPDPGESGKQTIEGIDSDNDGIRDDVERVVSLMYASNAKARAFGYVMAKTYQTLIENPNMSKSEMKRVLLDIFQTSDCTDKATNHQVKEKIMPYVLNTYERSIRYIEILRDSVHGMTLPNSKSCNQ